MGKLIPFRRKRKGYPCLHCEGYGTVWIGRYEVPCGACQGTGRQR